MPLHDVFISHSSKDKLTADKICAFLEANGIRCWITPRDILPGSNWGESIIDAINDTKVMLLVFSANCNASSHIKREVERAVNRRNPVIPIRIEDAMPSKSLEYFISSQHWLDVYTPPLEKHLDHLAMTLKMLLSKIGGEPEVSKPASRSITRHDPHPSLPVSSQTIIEPFRKRPAGLPGKPLAKGPKSKTLILISGGAVGLALIGSLLWIVLPPAAKKPMVTPEPAVAKQEPAPVQPLPEVASIPSPPPPVTADAETRAKDFLEQGRNYIRVKDYEKARAALEQAVNIDSKNAMAHYELGIAYANLGNKQKVMEEHKILETQDKELANKLFAYIPKAVSEPSAFPRTVKPIKLPQTKKSPGIGMRPAQPKASSVAPSPKEW
ncbi:MAG: TIR domain-containing protein [Planctomycetes bacterium]|nr:TIR domain-containing protein [Planctomycetota bacterium]MCG2771392.1 TIR domain-containing protein [Desulfobacterales bacterium]